jgi:hypothetical protein
VGGTIYAASPPFPHSVETYIVTTEISLSPHPSHWKVAGRGLPVADELTALADDQNELAFTADAATPSRRHWCPPSEL